MRNEKGFCDRRSQYKDGQWLGQQQHEQGVEFENVGMRVSGTDDEVWI